MVSRVDTAEVKLWGETVGALAWMTDQGYAVFEYAPEFLKKDWDISPIHMSIADAQRGDATFAFPALNRETFKGLPGLLADALPDKYGNNIIDAWLARQGRSAQDFSPVERLCYMGKRGMGALEFEPSAVKKFETSVAVEIADLVSLAQTIMKERAQLDVELGNNQQSNADAILDILRVGTSAGGARPKAIIAMNDQGDVRSGQSEAPADFDFWILKFDGVSDLELGEPQGYGRIEYAYYLMAKAAGINMTECRLLEENGRAHFLTKRFDRVVGEKLHMHSLCGLAHYDFNQAGAYSYEQAFAAMRTLRLSKAEAAEQFRRMVFNLLSRNQDDHTKNISFLIGQSGNWLLSPAYDVTYAHNPGGRWTNLHQMTVNGKRDDFFLEDVMAVAESIKLNTADKIIDEVREAVSRWSEFAKEAGVPEKRIKEIGEQHRVLEASS